MKWVPGVMLCALVFAAPGLAAAADRIDVVASFSVLGDLVHAVGGDRVHVRTLVGPDGDAHAYEPTPDDIRAVAGADLLVINGLGLEGWMTRLVDAASYQGTTLVASDGIVPLEGPGEGAEAGDGGDGANIDPHAWNDPDNAEIYVANIADGLAALDPGDAALYRSRAADYAREIAAIDAQNREAFARIPRDQRLVLTSHDAFGYFGRHYGIDFVAPVGISTDSEPSAQDVARIVDQIRAGHIRAVFVENITDPRLIDQIAAESGARVGGTLYSDALSAADGPAPTYAQMLAHNARLIAAALGPTS